MTKMIKQNYDWSIKNINIGPWTDCDKNETNAKCFAVFKEVYQNKPSHTYEENKATTLGNMN